MTVKRGGGGGGGVHSLNKEVHEILFERRLLTFVTAMAGVGVVVWLAALATDYWIVVVADQLDGDKTGVGGVGDNGGHKEGRQFLWSYSGLWKFCAVYRNVSSGDSVTECALHHGSGGLSAANQFLRAELGVCLVAVFLILLAAGFSAYSLRHPRYTYKRIAGALHLFVAAVLIALMEMVRSEAHLDVHQLSRSVLTSSRVWYGYSYLLSWVVCIIFMVSGVAFFANSKKRKMLPFDYETNFK